MSALDWAEKKREIEKDEINKRDKNKNKNTIQTSHQYQYQYHSATRNKGALHAPLSPVSNASPSIVDIPPLPEPSARHTADLPAPALMQGGSDVTARVAPPGTCHSGEPCDRRGRRFLPVVASAFTVHFLGADRRRLGRSAPAQRGGCSHPDIICPVEMVVRGWVCRVHR